VEVVTNTNKSDIFTVPCKIQLWYWRYNSSVDGGFKSCEV